MLEAIPDWSIHLLAAVLVLFHVLPSVMKGFGLSGYRFETFGGPSDLMPEGGDEPYADYHSQFLELGFEPLGCFRERVLGQPSCVEYMFLHREQNCRAAVYKLAGGDPRVALTTEFVDGTLVRTMNYSGDERDTADYVDRRLPTHSMKRLLQAHHHARFRFAKDGKEIVACRTLEDVGEAERAAFHHPAVQRAYRSNETHIAIAKLSLLGVTAGCVATMVKQLGDMPMPSAFSAGVLVVLALRFVYKRFVLRSVLARMTAEQDAADAGRLPSPSREESG